MLCWEIGHRLEEFAAPTRDVTYPALEHLKCFVRSTLHTPSEFRSSTNFPREVSPAAYRMSKPHPYRALKIPKNAPFTLNPSPGKGWGAFATQSINAGTMILVEELLFIIRKAHEAITEIDVGAAVQQLTAQQKNQVLLLRDNASKPFSHMTEAFAENSFAIQDREQLQTRAHGLFLLHSRINHSCVPNCKIPTNNEEHVASYATRDIAVGEELTFCYEGDFELRRRHDRHQRLRFVCDCIACLPNTPYQELSDMRRTLLRGLQYLTLGHDFDGQRQDSNSSIFLHAEWKEAAETFRIPIGTRLACDLLVMVLLEEEGLLDEMMVERLRLTISTSITLFKTGRNAWITRLAMERQTWSAKFGFASRLYGCEDAADAGIVAKLQMLSLLRGR
ncbi:hypothetical protein BDV95DRAFT_252556 [Massariosphaeria phaeospora]|uniref:SET domain-containing protein n=1 Tax=Massariosphaeria phaeospora TaxID=100035 RepID=A0A7C8MC50_9PLEO|nr:hypothetical protein BDV95DRAFT_252556 [Massariosphaeria phaeospora]